jgi:TRAP-type C4-dicarboxylate transport system permease small subunit
MAEGSGELVVLSITPVRKFVFILMQLARLFIAGVLYHVGALYLVRTWRISDVRCPSPQLRVPHTSAYSAALVCVRRVARRAVTRYRRLCSTRPFASGSSSSMS